MANNPSDPEAASMEVSETKLVNFAEKTRFDVTSEFKFPDPSEGGGVGDDLAVLGLTLVPPDISTLQNSNGTWIGSPRTSFVRTVRCDRAGKILWFSFFFKRHRSVFLNTRKL